MFGLLTATVVFLGTVLVPGNGFVVSSERSSALPSAPPPASAHSTSPASFDTLHTVSRQVLRYTNETRRERGLSPLKEEPTLAKVACAHNGDMFRRDFLQHENPDGELPQDRVAKMHRRLIGGVSENLYGQTRIRRGPDALASLMIEKWLNSPPHRKNLLSPDATHLGVCVLRRGNTLRATQLFANVVAYLSTPLPRTVDRGAVLPLSIAQTFPPTTSIAQYDFWDPRTEQRVTAPTVFTDSLHVPDTTGTLRTRFYVLDGSQYVIHQGPEITIRPSQ